MGRATNNPINESNKTMREKRRAKCFDMTHLLFQSRETLGADALIRGLRRSPFGVWKKHCRTTTLKRTPQQCALSTTFCPDE
jgi:hypothetical protein